MSKANPINNTTPNAESKSPGDLEGLAEDGTTIINVRVDDSKLYVGGGIKPGGTATLTSGERFSVIFVDHAEASLPLRHMGRKVIPHKEYPAQICECGRYTLELIASTTGVSGEFIIPVLVTHEDKKCDIYRISVKDDGRVERIALVNLDGFPIHKVHYKADDLSLFEFHSEDYNLITEYALLSFDDIKPSYRLRKFKNALKPLLLRQIRVVFTEALLNLKPQLITTLELNRLPPRIDLFQGETILEAGGTEHVEIYIDP